jgi:hypothetical protein
MGFVENFAWVSRELSDKNALYTGTAFNMMFAIFAVFSPWAQYGEVGFTPLSRQVSVNYCWLDHCAANNITGDECQQFPCELLTASRWLAGVTGGLAVIALLVHSVPNETRTAERLRLNWGWLITLHFLIAGTSLSAFSMWIVQARHAPEPGSAAPGLFMELFIGLTAVVLCYGSSAAMYFGNEYNDMHSKPRKEKPAPKPKKEKKEKKAISMEQEEEEEEVAAPARKTAPAASSFSSTTTTSMLASRGYGGPPPDTSASSSSRGFGSGGGFGGSARGFGGGGFGSKPATLPPVPPSFVEAETSGRGFGSSGGGFGGGGGGGFGGGGERSRGFGAPPAAPPAPKGFGAGGGRPSISGADSSPAPAARPPNPMAAGRGNLLAQIQAGPKKAKLNHVKPNQIKDRSAPVV